ncbi:MAG TPA: hypothetical protein VIL34_05150 [Actinopolymorphaceae bacterium]|jgi:hypothetical protein
MTDIRPRAAVLATLGAIAVAASAYFDWLAGRSPRDIPVQQLLLQGGSTDTVMDYWQSMATPLVVISAIGVLGALFLSRFLLWLAFLFDLAALGLWVASVVLEASPGEVVVGDLQAGAWIALGSVILLLIGAAALRRRPNEVEEEDEFETPPLTRQMAVDDGP